MYQSVFTKNILTNKKKPSRLSILLKILGNVILKNKKLFLAGFILAIITAVINFNLARNIKEAFVYTASGTTHIKDINYRFVFNFGFFKIVREVGLIRFLFYFFFLMVVGKSIFSLFHYYCLNYAFDKVEKDLKKDLFRHFIHAPYENSSEVSGNLINQFAIDLDYISRNIWFIPNRLFYVTTSITFYICFAFGFGNEGSINWRFMWIVIALFGALFLIIYYLFRKAIKLNTVAKKRYQLDNQHIYERINNLEYIKAVSGEKLEEEKLDKQLDSTFEKNRRSLLWGVLFKAFPTYVIIPNIPLFFIIVSIFVFRNFIPGESGWDSPIFTAVSFGLYYSSVQSLRDEVSKIVDAFSSIEDLAVDVDLTMKTVEKLEGKKNLTNQLKLPFENGDIIYDKVTFAYPGRPNNVILQNFSFIFHQGKSYGIIGENGKGKSTITKTLLKLYNLQEGQISINNQNIRNISTPQLHEKILYLTNRPGFFRMSIAENIVYPHRYQKEIDLPKIEKAVKKVGIDKFIKSLPLGFDTELKENGSDLSEGQKQQIAIIRLFIRDYDIYVLDEILSNVNPVLKEEILVKAFQKIKGRTIFVIDHHYEIFRYVEKVYKFTGKSLLKVNKEKLGSIVPSRSNLQDIFTD